MRACAWSGDTSDRLVQITIPAVDGLGRRTAPRVVHVLPEHREHVEDYARQAQRRARPFTLALGSLIVVVLAAALLGGAGVLDEQAVALAIGVALAALGALLVIIPFTTPQTIEAFGIRRSIRAARVIGVVTIALGSVIAAMA